MTHTSSVSVGRLFASSLLLVATTLCACGSRSPAHGSTRSVETHANWGGSHEGLRMRVCRAEWVTSSTGHCDLFLEVEIHNTSSLPRTLDLHPSGRFRAGLGVDAWVLVDGEWLSALQSARVESPHNNRSIPSGETCRVAFAMTSASIVTRVERAGTLLLRVAVRCACPSGDIWIDAPFAITPPP
jgi:hypothetical protein